MTTTAEQVAGAGPVNRHLPARTRATAGRHHGRSRGHIRIREGDLHVAAAAVSAGPGPVRCYGTGVQDLAGLNIDLPTARTVGMKLPRVDQYVRSHIDA